jgi:hypothetical protein
MRTRIIVAAGADYSWVEVGNKGPKYTGEYSVTAYFKVGSFIKIRRTENFRLKREAVAVAKKWARDITAVVKTEA